MIDSEPASRTVTISESYGSDDSTNLDDSHSHSQPVSSSDFPLSPTDIKCHPPSQISQNPPSKPLRRTQKGRQALRLYLMGHTLQEISDTCNWGVESLRRYFEKPDIQAVILSHVKEQENRIQMLYGNAVDALKDGLGDGDIKTRLSAGDRVFRILGKFRTPLGEGGGAEDQVARVLNLQVNIENK